MPLSKARNAERMRQARLHVQPKSDNSVQPKQATVKPNLEDLRNLIKGIERGEVTKPESLVQPNVQPSTPLYNPSAHKAGDKVLVKQGSKLVEAVIPKLDASGNPIPEYD